MAGPAGPEIEATAGAEHAHAGAGPNAPAREATAGAEYAHAGAGPNAPAREVTAGAEHAHAGAGPSAPARKVQRTRDPEARKRALAAAALEIVAEVGIGRTTHRAVASRAGLPLGATTYYFPTLDDLIAAGLAQATDTLRADLIAWAERLRAAPSLAEALVELSEECMTDRPRTQIEYELYVAAARDAALRPLALAWLDGLNDLLVPRVGATAARNISALLDGAMIQSLVTGEPLDKPALTDAINRLSA